MEINRTYYGIKQIQNENEEYFDYIYDCPEGVDACSIDGEPIYELTIEIHEDQSDLFKNMDSNQDEIDYIGYLEAESNSFSLINTWCGSFACCFAYGYDAAEKNGEGKAYRLKIVESTLWG